MTALNPAGRTQDNLLPLVWTGLCVLVLGLGCSPTPTKTLPFGDGADPSASAAPVAPAVFGVGDVETSLRLRVTLNAQSRGPNVRSQEDLSAKQEILRTTVDIYDPLPEELWATFELSCYADFPGHAAVVRVAMFSQPGDADPVEIGRFNVVLGDNARDRTTTVKANALEPLPQRPDTLLVYAKADIILFMNTEEDAVDPETATTDNPAMRAALLSNPMRVNFLGGPAPAAPVADQSPGSSDSARSTGH